MQAKSKAGMLWGWLLAASAGLGTAQAQEGVGDVVYVPTPQIVVETMLKMAKVGPDDFIIDLGSGDGRMVITAAKEYGARGFGVDLDPVLLKLSNDNAKAQGVADRAQFFERNLFDQDLSQATVISSYLLPEMNEKLRPKILALKPGTRVVAHDYHMGAWYPDQNDRLSVPEKTVGQPGVSYLYLWIVPARIAGKWHSDLPSPGGGMQNYDFTFNQIFQKFTGTAQTGGQNLMVRNAELTGDQITFTVTGRIGGQNNARQDFRGRVKGDVIEGTVRTDGGAGTAPRTLPWTAKLTQRGEMQQGDNAPARVPVAAVQ